MRCKIFCAGTIALVAGLSGLGAWLWMRSEPEPLEAEAPPPPPARHASAAQLLAATAERLHQEALAHFHADPQNGRARMPAVYEKVVKEWKTPWFSTGELDRDEPVPFAKDMARIHEAGLTDFLSPPVPTANAATLASAIIWEEGKYDRSRKVWEPKSVDLIGLLRNSTPVAYVSEKIARQEDEEPPTRPLDEFEFAGLTALNRGEHLFGRTREGVIRVLGAVRAQASCLACHKTKSEGDLLGAFSYTLREGTYERLPWPGRQGMPALGAPLDPSRAPPSAPPLP
jgi:hypothetical protein